MYTLKIENTNGEIFELSHNNQNYAIIGVTGLTRPATDIHTSAGGGLDGEFYNSSRVQMRNIVITVVLRGNIEENRQRLYRIFPMKTHCAVYFSNKNRNVKIFGYVEILDADLFTEQETVQISIICPRPFWQDMQTIYTELSQIVSMFQFPFAIEETPGVPFSEIVDYPTCRIDNVGDVACGCVITIDILNDGQANPVDGLTIYNLTTQTYFGLATNRTFGAGDQIVINTISGQMSVTLNRAGTTENLLNYVVSGSSWFKLAVGENLFTFTAVHNMDAVKINFATGVLYGGV